MPRYKVTLTRVWTETDYLERVVEAESAEAASEIADRLAAEYNLSCPDDVETSKSGQAGEWGIEDLEEAADELPA